MVMGHVDKASMDMAMNHGKLFNGPVMIVMSGRDRGLRALKRLIEYALAESEDLAQPLPGRLLGAAALVTGEELERLKSLKKGAGGRRVERKADDGPQRRAGQRRRGAAPAPKGQEAGSRLER
jgi:hypothetical protein